MALNDVAGGGWKAESKQVNTFHGNGLANVYRMMWNFLFPLQILFNRRKYERIVGGQQFYAIFPFGVRLFRLRKVNGSGGENRPYVRCAVLL